MRVTVLSPHRDDAAFSCGLLLNSLLHAGAQVSIVTICTISRYAPYASSIVTGSTEEVSSLRREEDLCFFAKLCEGLQHQALSTVDLEWLDLPLRWRTKDEESLSHRSIPLEEQQALETAFRSLEPSDLFLTPMALGGHIDHRLVSQAAIEAFPTEALVFYEDLPYACWKPETTDLPSQHASDPSLAEIWLPMAGHNADLKRDYAACYPSQIAIDVVRDIEHHAMQHGGKERYIAGLRARDLLKAALQFGCEQIV